MSRWIPLVLVGACCPPEPAKKVTVSTVQQPSAKPELRELAVDGEVHLKNLHQLTFGFPEGLERSRQANWKHGYYSREAKAEAAT
jgi:hypothetical protein